MCECLRITAVYLLHEVLIGFDRRLVVVDEVPAELRNQKSKCQGV